MTTTYDLNALADKHLAAARNAAHGRSAHLLLREEPLRQSLIALKAGSGLEDHSAPRAATIQVLRGEAVLTAVSGDVTLKEGRLHGIPQERHGLRAITDVAVLFTAVND